MAVQGKNRESKKKGWDRDWRILSHQASRTGKGVCVTLPEFLWKEGEASEGPTRPERVRKVPAWKKDWILRTRTNRSATGF